MMACPWRTARAPPIRRDRCASAFVVAPIGPRAASPTAARALASFAIPPLEHRRLDRPTLCRGLRASVRLAARARCVRERDRTAAVGRAPRGVFVPDAAHRQSLAGCI